MHRKVWLAQVGKASARFACKQCGTRFQLSDATLMRVQELLYRATHPAKEAS
jgi:hypothetical protein